MHLLSLPRLALTSVDSNAVGKAWTCLSVSTATLPFSRFANTESITEIQLRSVSSPGPSILIRSANFVATKTPAAADRRYPGNAAACFTKPRPDTAEFAMPSSSFGPGPLSRLVENRAAPKQRAGR